MTLRLDPADPLSTLLTLDEAAEIAGVTRRTVERWIATGRLRYHRTPTRVYVTERDLLDAEAASYQWARRHGPRVSQLGILT